MVAALRAQRRPARAAAVAPKPAKTKAPETEAKPWRAGKTAARSKATLQDKPVELSAAAKAFLTSPRKAADLERLWSADPVGAARWTQAVAKSLKLTSAPFKQLDAALGKNASAAALGELLKKQPGLLKLNVDEVDSIVDAAQSRTWRAPVLHGKVTLANGLPKLVTSQGQFTIQNANGTMGGTDMVAMAGLDVSARAWPVTNDQLAVEEFVPGIRSTFTSGRVIPGGRHGVALDLGTNRIADVTNADFAKRLLPFTNEPTYGGAGVLLPHDVSEKNGKVTYDAPSSDFYLLTGYVNGADGAYTGQTAHGKSVQIRGPASAFKGELGSRVYAYGHIPDAAEGAKVGLTPSDTTLTFVASWTSKGAGNFQGKGMTTGQPSAAFVVRATTLLDPAAETFAPPKK